MYKYFDLLKKYSFSDKYFEIVVSHSLEVLEKSISIIKIKKLYSEVDFDLIVSGSFLHDIGTFEFLERGDKENYIKHGIVGGAILRKEGLEREALVAERHIGSGLSKKDIIDNNFPIPKEDFLPISLEEKIICYADKFSSKSGKVDSMENIEKEFRGYGKDSFERFIKLRDMFE